MIDVGKYLLGATNVWCALGGWSLFWLVDFLWILGWLLLWKAIGCEDLF